MSKKCPYCDSYNTEVSVGNFVGRGLLNAGRFALAGGTALIVGAFNHAGAHIAAHSVMKETDPGEFKGCHCCNCGKDFSA